MPQTLYHASGLTADNADKLKDAGMNVPGAIVKSLIKSNESKEPKQQGIHICQPPLFPQPFDPRPRLLYRVEIRAIGRKPQHRMPLSLQRIQRVLPLVEGSIIHHDHAAGR